MSRLRHRAILVATFFGRRQTQGVGNCAEYEGIVDLAVKGICAGAHGRQDDVITRMHPVHDGLWQIARQRNRAGRARTRVRMIIRAARCGRCWLELTLEAGPSREAVIGIGGEQKRKAARYGPRAMRDRPLSSRTICTSSGPSSSSARRGPETK